MSISEKNCLHICYDLTTIRIYYIDGEYYLNLVDLEKIHPAIFKKAYQARDWLITELQDKKNIDVRFYYRTDTPIKQKMKILDLNGYYNSLDLIYNCLLLLI